MFFTHDFYEKLILLGLTALISGLLVPWILKRNEVARSNAASVAAARSTLLDQLSGTVWRWRYLVRLIPYYAVENPAMYDVAKKNYDEKIWDILMELRIETSKARILLSKKGYDKFYEFYELIVNEIDGKITSLIEMERTEKKFEEQAIELSNFFHNEVSEKIDEMLLSIAIDMKLK